MGTERPRERLVPPHRGGRGWEEPEREREAKGVGVEKFLESAAAKPVRALVLWAQFPSAGCRVRRPDSWDPRTLGPPFPQPHALPRPPFPASRPNRILPEPSRCPCISPVPSLPPGSVLYIAVRRVVRAELCGGCEWQQVGVPGTLDTQIYKCRP